MTERRKRFALILKNDVTVENLESLRENFDLEKIRQYFESGELLEWLKSWRYSDLVPKIESLVDFDSRLNRKLCKIFKVDYEQHAPIEEIEIQREKLTMLKEITSESNIISKIDQVAFNTGEVHDLLEDGTREIFLFDGSYNFSCGIFDEPNIHYRGIGDVSIKIETDMKIDFAERGIEFENISVDGENFPKIVPEDIYLEGKKLFEEKNYDQAVEYLKKAAKLKNLDAMKLLADCYFYGRGIEQNLQQAFDYYRRSADLGNPESRNAFADFYYNGYVVKQNYSRAFKYYEQAVKLGNITAMKNLGNCYFYGRGIEQNYEKAVELYLKTVDNLDAEAMNNLGECYYNGLGTKQTFKKAVQLFKKAVELGNSDAMNNLGIACRDGRGISPDKKKAAELFKKSAQLGNAKAKKNLSQL